MKFTGNAEVSPTEVSQVSDMTTVYPPISTQSIQSFRALGQNNYSCLPALFEEQVNQTPDAPAVMFHGTTWTYQELNNRANQLAHYLISQGVKPETLVAVYMERSLHAIVAILGILKAGGAYVPIDPALPEERTCLILGDTEVNLVLTTTDQMHRLKTFQGHCFCLDAAATTLSEYPTVNPHPAATEENLAYVIYTSGSTGKPKGVMIPHRGIVNQILWRINTFPLTATDRVFQTIALSFDPSVWQIFWPLSCGAQLVLAEPDGQKDPTYLVQTIIQQHITVVALVPSLLRVLLQIPGVNHCTSLKYVFCGGEALPGELVEQFSQIFVGQETLYNVYGPTEASIDATYWHCQLGDVPAIAPIGYPIANTQIYVLGSNLETLPVGQVGEIYIGGSGLARGYLNRPDLTAERFLPSPFSEHPEVKLYKTGDLGRWRCDGALEFLGRVDHQVKIRGFRIELGEIEAIFRSHPAVNEAVVLVNEARPEQKHLVAYVTYSIADVPSMEDLRAFLLERLPVYMLPTVIVELESLPLNSNGKVDRKALATLELPQQLSDRPITLPRTSREADLVNIWQEVLGMPVGIDDNFFALGGHSLLAAQAVSRINQTFGIDLALKTFFEAPTIAELGDRIETIQSATPPGTAAIAAANSYPSIRQTRKTEILPLSSAQTRLWFLDQLEPGTAAYNMPANCRLRGALNVGALAQSFNEIINRHAILRTKFPSMAGQPRQVIVPAQPLTLSVVDLRKLSLEQQEAEVNRQIEEAAHHAFDLTQGPLLHVKLLRLAEQEHVLLLTVHHIIFDGWSFSLFFQELSHLYEHFCQGTSTPLNPLPIQYADFACWQQQLLETEKFQAQLAYWQQQLAEPLPILQLPTDYPRSTQQDYRGAHHTLVLPESLTRQLKDLSQKSGTTLFMTFLAALNVLLHRLSGQDDIIVGTPIAGRPQIDTENLIGLFLNSLALRTDLTGNPTFAQLLKQVRQTTLEAFENQDVPFEKLTEELNPERSLNRHPIFEVMLNFVNTPRIPLEMHGLSLTPIELTHNASKFTMTLYVSEQGDQLQLILVYQQALFTADRMKVFLDQLQHLLSQVVTQADQPILSYSLVTPGTASRLPDPRDVIQPTDYELVPARVLSWGEQSPTLAAICQGEQTWTYGELTEQAQAIARGLLSEGLQAGDVVAVSGDRSFGLIASALGVIVAGGVLLLVDPKLPSQRRHMMLTAANASRLLWVSSEPVNEDDWLSLAAFWIAPPTGKMLAPLVVDGTVRLPALKPDDPAYIFFTSGTTGVPKGVLGRHKGLAHFLSWQRQTFAITPRDRVAQLTGLSFDVVLRDIFLPLTSGATLCLPAADASLSGTQVLPWLTQQRITVMHTVPSLASVWLMNIPAAANLEHLRWVFFAGEPLSDQLVQQWRSSFSQTCQIVNLYGPTETTLAKCYFLVPDEPVAGIQPVGKPMPETQALILSSTDALCGLGEIGEIVLRTPFRTLGYINASAEQHHRFRQNPYRDESEDKVYYSGDLGRYRLDGSVEILGRIDHQVKIRGVRIELGEIKAAFISHSLISDAVVVVRDDATGNKSLVAYVVPQPEAAPTVSELRHFIQQRLPESMVPSGIVFLAALPLTPNGKVDRQALPPVSFDGQARETAYEAPHTLLEETLAQIWGETLNLEQIGIHDNFFELGGHSLLAVQTAAAIEQVLEQPCPIAYFFQFPTVSQLAAQLQNKATDAVHPSLFPIQTGKSTKIVFCVHVLGANLAFYRPLASHLKDVSFLGIASALSGDPNAPHPRDIQKLATYYLEVIKLAQPEGPYYLLGFSFGGHVVYEIAQQLVAQGDEVKLLGLLDSYCPVTSHAYWMARFKRHVQNIWRQGLPYIWQRLPKPKKRLDNLRPNAVPSSAESDAPFKLDSAGMQARSLLRPEEHHKVNQDYQLVPYPGKVTLFRAQEDPDPKLSWGDLADDGLVIHDIPGNHLSMLAEPNVQILAEKLKEILQ